MLTARILLIIVAALIISLHIGCALFEKKIAEILSYVNLGLHIALLFMLMVLKVSFEFMALTYMASLFIYLLPAFIKHKRMKRGGAEDDV